jgi:hypothetical protein
MVPVRRRPTAGRIAFAVFCFGVSALGGSVLLAGLVLVASGRLPLVVGVGPGDRSVSVSVSQSPELPGSRARRGFNVKVPSGWTSHTVASGDNGSVGMVIERNSAPATIRVTQNLGQLELPAAAYAQGLRDRALDDRSRRARGEVESTQLGGEPAAAYTIEDAQGMVTESIVCVQADDVFQVQLSAPAGQFDALRNGAFATFLASWHWQ